MRLTLILILIVIICIVLTDAHRGSRGWGRGGRRRGGWKRWGRLGTWRGGQRWERRGGGRGYGGNNWPPRRHCQPVDGNWGPWSDYDECSVTCNAGTQKRYRFCNNPAPEYRGHACFGRNQEKRHCNRCPCPVDSCNNRCLNNAPCKNGICDCPPMFSGEDCGTKTEPVDLCENITCLNDGQCVSGICKCTPGYGGDNCSVNLCEITDCPGETTPCVPILAPGGYACSCVKRSDFFSDSSYTRCDARSIITSPKRYDSDLNVTTTIPGVPGKNLTISFIDDFFIYLADECDVDSVTIDGTRYCGYTAPEDITLPTGAGTQVRFVTDDVNNYDGYTLAYQYIDAVSDSNRCKNGGTPTADESCNCMSGFEGSNCEFPAILTSGGKYLDGKNTTFTLPGFPEKELVLTFDEDFSIETTDGNCNDTRRNDCTEDYVEIESIRYCGGVAPGPITIPTGNGTTVRFVSNDDGDECRTGFTLTYVYRDP